MMWVYGKSSKPNEKGKVIHGSSKQNHSSVKNNNPRKVPQKRIKKGKASNPEKKQNGVIKKIQRNLSKGERQALQHFLFKVRKQNGLRSMKWKLKKNEPVEYLIKQAKSGRPTKGKSMQYELSGGYDRAVGDFKLLKPSIIKDTPNLKIGKLNDGRMVNVRVNSTDKRPTLEIQDGPKKIKFRYDN